MKAKSVAASPIWKNASVKHVPIFKKALIGKCSVQMYLAKIDTVTLIETSKLMTMQQVMALFISFGITKIISGNAVNRVMLQAVI